MHTGFGILWTRFQNVPIANAITRQKNRVVDETRDNSVKIKFKFLIRTAANLPCCPFLASPHPRFDPHNGKPNLRFWLRPWPATKVQCLKGEPEHGHHRPFLFRRYQWHFGFLDFGAGQHHPILAIRRFNGRQPFLHLRQNVIFVRVPHIIHIECGWIICFWQIQSLPWTRRRSVFTAASDENGGECQAGDKCCYQVVLLHKKFISQNKIKLAMHLES